MRSPEGSGLELAVPARRVSATDILDLAAQAEDRGWAGVWMPEVLTLDALVMQGALARATSSVRLGTSIVPVSTRSVALLAMASATIAQLAPGRFTLGLGVSTPAIVDQRHDRPVRRPLAETRGALEVIRSLLEGATVDHEADPRIAALRIEAPPEAPRLVLAALGPKMVALAHELADGVMLNLVPSAALSDYVTRADAASRPAFETLLIVRVCIEPTPEDRAAIEREVASYCRVPFYAANFARCGFDLEALGAADTIDDAVRLLPEGLVDDLVAMGSARECRDRLTSLQRLGVKPIVVAAGQPGGLPRIIDDIEPHG